MKRRLVSVAIVVTVGLLLTILVLIPRPPSPPIMVHHIKSVRSGNLVTATFEITNHTTSHYFVYPVAVEVRNGSVWITCFDFNSFPGPILGPHGFDTPTFDMTNLPTGSPVRLRMSVGKELAGLEGLFIRLDLRFRRGQKKVPINPFDETTEVFSSKPTQVVSDEFKPKEREPEGSKK